MARIDLFAVLVLVPFIFGTTNGQYACHRTDTTITCKAPTASSSYYGYTALYGPTFAVDRVTSYSNMGFFHSNYEAYPYWSVELSAAKIVNVFRMQTRCDANQWWHFQNIEIRQNNAALTTIPGMEITTGTICNNIALSYWYQCGAVVTSCLAPAATTTHFTVQQKVLDTMGGTSNGWGNQHSNVPFYFLMANEFEFY